MKKIVPIILCLLVITGVIGVGTSLGNSKNSDTQEAIVKIDAKTTTLTKNQIKSLDNGADITLDSEVYRLSKVGDEKIYEHTDGENIFLTKYIAVDSKKRTYRKWEKVNEEVVTKAIMNSVLTDKDNGLAETLKDYVTDEQLTEILTEYEKGSDLTTTLSKYLTKEQTQAALTSYYTKTEITNLLSGYIRTGERKPIVSKYLTSLLNFQPNTVYAVQCYDKSTNLTDFMIVGGGKDGKKGRFAMVFVGDKATDSLIVYQTGSALVTDLAGTSGGSTGIVTVNSTDILKVYEIAGKAV